MAIITSVLVKHVTAVWHILRYATRYNDKIARDEIVGRQNGLQQTVCDKIVPDKIT